jgi:hypothetical protein
MAYAEPSPLQSWQREDVSDVSWLHTSAPNLVHDNSNRSALIDSFLSTVHNGRKHAVAYWYCDSRDSPAPTLGTFVVSLLQQLARQSHKFPRNLMDLYESNKYQPVDSLPVGLLKTAISDLISATGIVYLFIDALDEFSSEGTEDLLSFLSMLHDINWPGLHIAVASQPQYFVLSSQLQAMSPCLVEVQAYNEADIRLHIRQTLTVSPYFARRWGSQRQDVLDLIDSLWET